LFPLHFFKIVYANIAQNLILQENNNNNYWPCYFISTSSLKSAIQILIDSSCFNCISILQFLNFGTTKWF
jgi:hypothetical protein